MRKIDLALLKSLLSFGFYLGEKSLKLPLFCPCVSSLIDRYYKAVILAQYFSNGNRVGFQGFLSNRSLISPLCIVQCVRRDGASDIISFMLGPTISDGKSAYGY